MFLFSAAYQDVASLGVFYIFDNGDVGTDNYK
jgi:hypothetical protein